MQKFQAEKILLKIHFKNGNVQRIQKREKRRISLILRAVKNSEANKFYICVTYSPIVDNSNKVLKPKNAAYCRNKKETLYLLNCFTEN